MSNHSKRIHIPRDEFRRSQKVGSAAMRFIPSHDYTPRPKPDGRRDRIRAGLQRRDQRNMEVV